MEYQIKITSIHSEYILYFIVKCIPQSHFKFNFYSNATYSAKSFRCSFNWLMCMFTIQNFHHRIPIDYYSANGTFAFLCFVACASPSLPDISRSRTIKFVIVVEDVLTAIISRLNIRQNIIVSIIYGCVSR